MPDIKLLPAEIVENAQRRLAELQAQYRQQTAWEIEEAQKALALLPETPKALGDLVERAHAVFVEDVQGPEEAVRPIRIAITVNHNYAILHRDYQLGRNLDARNCRIVIAILPLPPKPESGP